MVRTIDKPKHKRNNSGESPLGMIGMIVDRSSFDEHDSPAVSKASSGDFESQGDGYFANAINGSPQHRNKAKTKNGKVRRKLRWRPSKTKSRNEEKSSDPTETSDATVISGRTMKSNHTFNSTETPKIGNGAIPQIRTKAMFDDLSSFGGSTQFSTIENEGQIVQNKMKSKKRFFRAIKKNPTFDFEPIDETAISFAAFDDMSRSEPRSFSFDPFLSEKDQEKQKKLTSISLPRVKAPRSLLSSPQTPEQLCTPVKVKKPFLGNSSPDSSLGFSPRRTDSPAGTPTTYNSDSIDDISLGFFPTEEPNSAMVTLMAPEDYEEERRIDLWAVAAETCSAKKPLHMEDYSVTEDAFNSGIHESEPHGRNLYSSGTQPFDLASKSFDAITTDYKSKSPVRNNVGKPPRVPPTNMSSTTNPLTTTNFPKSPTEAVPARVDHIDLSSQLANLKSMAAASGLMFELTNNNATTTTTMDSDDAGSGGSSLSSKSPSLDEKMEFAVADKNSINSSAHSGNNSQGGAVRSNSGSRASSHCNSPALIPPPPVTPKRRKSPRRTNVPVDADDGSFLNAETNLRAIHQMAAEHLAHGEFEEALEVFEEILRGQKQRYGDTHYRVGTALHNLGIAYLKSRQYQKAIEVCDEAVRVRKEALVPNHPDVAVSLAQLGVAQLECQAYKEALVAFREALRIRREFLGNKHPKVGKILNNVGCALFELCELEGSKMAFEEALEIQRDTLKNAPNNANAGSASNHALLSIASTLCNLGSIQLRRQEFEEAAIALEEALLIQQSVLGDDNPIVLKTIESINFVEQAKDEGIDHSLSNLYTCEKTAITLGLIKSRSDETIEEHIGCYAPQGVSLPILSQNIMYKLGLDKSRLFYQDMDGKVHQKVGGVDCTDCIARGGSDVSDGSIISLTCTQGEF